VTTWVACLTPPGAAAIATLAVRGPQAWPIVRELFKPVSAKGSPLPEQPVAGKFWLGRFGGDAVDEVVLAVKEVSASPPPQPSPSKEEGVQGLSSSAEETGSQSPSPLVGEGWGGGFASVWLEIHCHGGVEVVRMLLECLAARGVERCSWQELELRTGHDPHRAEAAFALVNALTARTAAILLDQYHGAFERARQTIVNALAAGQREDAVRLLQELARWSPLGRHLTEPWKVTVLGAPNVGKSSLVNALAGFQRCVVAPTPGTTRDIVTTRIAADGWPIEVSDTAGLRPAVEALEAEGVRRARQTAGDADLCLWVVDASRAPVWPEPPLESAVFVINKIDLPAAWEWQQVEGVAVSALAGTGIAELCLSLGQRLVPAAPLRGAAVPFTARQCQAVADALRLCLNHEDEAARIRLESTHDEGSSP
jgi:tRNA modification GTPase